MEPGAVCDCVPEFNQDRSLVWVEYPGIVKNVDKMLQTMGGLKNISATYRETKKRLDLHFRPDDLCCHPVCGDRTSTMALLLKVRKYRKKKIPGETSRPDEFRYIPEIVGVVEESYKFNGLCDFQYLPLHNDVENDCLVNMLPHLEVTDLHESTYTKEVPLFLPPATFSRFDQQQNVLFRNDPKYKRPGRAGVEPDKIGVTRPKRVHFAQYIKYEDEWTPQEALPEAREMLDKLSNDDAFILSGIKDLFVERPIWSKNALVCKLKCNHERLKNILPALAYYFITGPWRSLWVKFGYDPRKIPEAAKYQLLDFRVRQGLNTPNIPIKAKRSTLTYRLPNLARSRTLTTSTVNNLDEQTASKAESARDFGDAVFVYKPGVLPAYRQTFYQICDIHHPAVVEMLKSRLDCSASAPKCDAKSGWLPDETASKVRDILSNDIQETIAATDKIQMKNMSRDGRKRAGFNKSQAQEDAGIVQEEDEDILALGILPSTSREEEDDDEVESDDEDSPTAILDALLEEEAVDDDDDDDEEFVEEDEDDESPIIEHDEELELEGTSGNLFGRDDDLENFMEDFNAYSPEM